MKYELDSLAFSGPTEPYREHIVRAHYLKPPNDQNALIEVLKDDAVVHSFLFPAYKVWNICAHHQDVIDGVIEQSDRGIRAAAWDGISGATLIVLKQPTE